MEPFKWRFASKTIAILHLILSTFDLMGAMIFSVAFAVVMIYPDLHGNKMTREYFNHLPGFLWLIIPAMFAVVAIDMWVALVLLKATELGSCIDTAMKNAKIWRNVVTGTVVTKIALTIIVASIEPVAGLFTLVIFFLDLLFRAIGIAIVHAFIGEVRPAAQAEINPYVFVPKD